MPVWNEIERPTHTRMLIVFIGALGLATTLYVAVALAGYYSAIHPKCPIPQMASTSNVIHPK